VYRAVRQYTPGGGATSDPLAMRSIQISSEWSLRDSEGGGQVEVSASPAVLLAYHERLVAFTEELSEPLHTSSIWQQ